VAAGGCGLDEDGGGLAAGGKSPEEGADDVDDELVAAGDVDVAAGGCGCGEAGGGVAAGGKSPEEGADDVDDEVGLRDADDVEGPHVVRVVIEHDEIVLETGIAQHRRGLHITVQETEGIGRNCGRFIKGLSNMFANATGST
jgi:hypothetical protein